jgi:hypothetical protein
MVSFFPMFLFVVICVLWVLSNYMEDEETEELGRRAAKKARDRSPRSVKEQAD